MKLRQRKYRKTSSSLVDEPHSSLPLPIELIIDIFSRLSLKSIAICRCVSKPWAFVVGRSDFRDLRLTRSRLLFAFKEGNKLFFLSSPQPQSPDEMSVAADHHMSFSFDHPIEDISASVSGLVCVRIGGHRFVNGRRFKVEESVICNPSTGQSFTVPRMKTLTRVVGIVRFLGYDPVEKLHKVLGMVRGHRDRTMDHQVLTLGGGTEKATWRMTECIPCVSSKLRENICINGVLYYIEADSDWSGDYMIICFHVRSEKYSFVNPPKRILHHKLLDCNGKLALIPIGKRYSFNSETVKMWVLEDHERHEWSKRVYIFPPVWKDVVDRLRSLEIVGVTGPNEFVLSSTYSSDPFQVYYCNFDKETVTRVVIQGVGALRDGRGYSIHTCLNHVEDVKLMEL